MSFSSFANFKNFSSVDTTSNLAPLSLSALSTTFWWWSPNSQCLMEPMIHPDSLNCSAMMITHGNSFIAWRCQCVDTGSSFKKPHAYWKNNFSLVRHEINNLFVRNSFCTRCHFIKGGHCVDNVNINMKYNLVQNMWLWF